MPCKTELFPCPECHLQVYSTIDNYSNDHGPGCPIAIGSIIKSNAGRKKLDLKGMLCETFKLLDEWTPEDTSLREELQKRDPRLVEFMDEHELGEQEKTRAQALLKLTPRERRALGIK